MWVNLFLIGLVAQVRYHVSYGGYRTDTKWADATFLSNHMNTKQRRPAVCPTNTKTGDRVAAEPWLACLPRLIANGSAFMMGSGPSIHKPLKLINYLK